MIVQSSNHLVMEARDGLHLARHWLARRHYPLASWLACIARSSRVLLFYRDHHRLLRLDVYRNYLTQVHDDVFHHLSHRNYLAKGLSPRQRVRCVHTHYRFECASFFCFAALQGLAEALGMDGVAAVKAAWQCAYDARDGQRFANAYDAFWQTLGGVPLDGLTWRIDLPLQLKPLAEMTSRHRKRAMQRRAHWRAIADAARAAILPHVLPQRQSIRNVQLDTNA